MFGGEWQRRRASKAWDEYTAAFEGLCASGLADVVAHCDLIKIAGVIPSDRAPWEDRMLAAIIAGGVTVEVSSAGWRKEVREGYPSQRLLDRLIEHDVPLVLGSDAHEPALIGNRFDELSATLRRAGVRVVTKFTRRVREAVSI